MSKLDYIEFQDRSQPVGYLITIRTYGTWLHYDERGSMDRKHHNHYGEPKIKPAPAFERQGRSWLKHPPVTFSCEQRLAVEAAIREVCVERGYGLHAVNARTNHVHTVVSASVKPELVMNALKPTPRASCAKCDCCRLKSNRGQDTAAIRICGRKAIWQERLIMS